MPKCQCKTATGKKCGRDAATGSKYCWQHQKCSRKTTKTQFIGDPQHILNILSSKKFAERVGEIAPGIFVMETRLQGNYVVYNIHEGSRTKPSASYKIVGELNHTTGSEKFVETSYSWK